MHRPTRRRATGIPLAAALLGLATLLTTGAAGAVVITETTFASTTQTIVSSSGVTNFTVAQGGGNPDPGLTVFSRLVGGSAATQRFIAVDGMVYDPGISGAVDAIDWSVDQRYDGFSNGGHGWGLGLEQGGTIFLLDLFSKFRSTSTPSNQLAFTTFSGADLVDDPFFRVLSGSGTLDLGSTGGAIRLGIVIFSGNGGAPSRQDQTSYDNLSFTFVQAVPEPAALALLAAGLALVGVRRRR